jgi:hypothetical protein
MWALGMSLRMIYVASLMDMPTTSGHDVLFLPPVAPMTMELIFDDGLYF